MKIDWRRKLASRKLWVAVAGLVTAVMLAFGAAESTAAQVSACILAAASVASYALGEGCADAAHKGDTQTNETQGE